MKVNQLFEKLIDKWPIKVICLIIAIFLYIINLTSNVEKKSFVLPLHIQAEGNVTNVGFVTQKVKVIVKVNESDIANVASSDFYAYVNLNYVETSGTYNIPVHVNVSDKVMAMNPLEVRVEPEYISMKVEEKSMKFAEIQPLLVGQVAYGYKISNIQVEPPFVEVEGPSSMINEVDYIYTDNIDVSNLQSDIQAEVYYKPLNKIISVKNKGPYQVKLTVEEEGMTREFTNLPIFPINLSDDFELDSELSNTSLILTGSVLNLENYQLSPRSVFVDFSFITEPGTYEIPVNYSVPSVLKINEKGIDKISVTVTKKVQEEQIPAEQTLEATE